MNTPTKRQSQILALIDSITEARGYRPTYRELMQQLGLSSPATLHKHIQNLKNKGLLKDKRAQKREKRSLPIIGSIAKGKKIELFAKAQSYTLDHVDVTATLYGFYANDDSFIDFSIIKGDLLIIKATSECLPSELLLTQSKLHGAQIGRLKVHYGEHFLDLGEKTLSFEEESLHTQGIIISLHRMY